MQRTKPPFRADHVGSLLRPAALREARAKRAKNEISAGDLMAIEDHEIERVIKKQEEVGLKATTDGEFRRSWWHLDFLWGLDGVERHVMESGVAFAAVKTRAEGVQISGKIGFSSHPMIEHYKFVADHTKATPKITDARPRHRSIVPSIPIMTRCSTISGRRTGRPCGHSPTPAAVIFSSTKSSSQCCVTTIIASR
jgi:5-methyltetrahydropteroyltriglutamate--homocysteine methyltransferase